MKNSDSGLIYSLPSLLRDWEDFTDIHTSVREQAETAVWKFTEPDKDEGIPALMIAGGLGSGKSQLLYRLFRYSWTNLKTPALYMDLRDLLNHVEALRTSEGTKRVRPEALLRYIRTVAQRVLENIKQSFEDRSISLRDLWLPSINQEDDMPPSALFDIIGATQAFDVIVETLEKNKRLILLIDEVEMAYGDLKDIMDGGLRDLTDAVSRGTANLYPVMAVSLLSYYELFLSEFSGDIAFERRVSLVQLPPLSPDVLHGKLEKQVYGSKSNTFWWFTRGRLGWVNNLKDAIAINDSSVSDLLSWDSSLQIRTPLAENIPVFDVDELHRVENKLCGINTECKAAVRYFTLNIRPMKLDNLPPFVRDNTEAISGCLTQCGKLSKVSDVVNEFISDLKSLLKTNIRPLSSDDYVFLQSRLGEVLSALSEREKGDGYICIGGPDTFLADDRAREFIDAVMDILMTYVSENYTYHKGSRDIVEALYLAYSTALSDTNWKKGSAFSRVRQIFMEQTGRAYLVLSPSVIRQFIPMYLSNPVVSKKPGVTVEELEQNLSRYMKSLDTATVAEYVKDLSMYLGRQEENLHIYIVPVPKGERINQGIKEKVSSVVKALVNEEMVDLKFGHRSLVFLFAGGSTETVGQVSGDIVEEKVSSDFLVNTTKRIIFDSIPAIRLSNFVKSIFDLLANERDQGNATTLEGALSQIRADQRRRADYFRGTISGFINDNLPRYVRERESSLSVTNVHNFSYPIVDYLTSIDRVIKRTSRFKMSVRTFATLFVALPDRRLIEELKYSLQPGGLIRVSALPSIYQDLARERVNGSIFDLFNIPIIEKTARAALEDYVNRQLSGAFEILEDDKLPLLNEFVDIIDKNAGIKYSEHNMEAIRMLYRTILLLGLLSQLKEQIINQLRGYIKSIKDRAESLKVQLNSVMEVMGGLCKDYRLCIDIKFGNGKNNYTIKDELEGISSAVETIETKLSGVLPGTINDPKEYFPLAYFAVFGLPNEKSVLLDEIKESLKTWDNGVYEKVYTPLSGLDTELKPLHDLMRNRTGALAGPFNISIYISSEGDLESARQTISNITSEVKSEGKLYKVAMQDISKYLQETMNPLNEAQDALDGLLKEV